MPTVTSDFTNPAFWHALGSSIVNGLVVMVVLSLAAVILSFASGASAARHWPKKDDAHPEPHGDTHGHAEAH